MDLTFKQYPADVPKDESDIFFVDLRDNGIITGFCNVQYYWEVEDESSSEEPTEIVYFCSSTGQPTPIKKNGFLWVYFEDFENLYENAFPGSLESN